MMNYIANKFNITVDEMIKEIYRYTRFYDAQDFSEQDKISLFVLAKVRDINNDDRLNLYKNGDFYNVSYKEAHETIFIDDSFYPKLFDFFDKNDLKYKI